MIRFYKNWEAIKYCGNASRYNSLIKLDMLSRKAQKKIRELPQYFIPCPEQPPIPISLLLEEEHQMLMNEPWWFDELSRKLLEKHGIPWDWYKPLEWKRKGRGYLTEDFPLLPEDINRENLKVGTIIQLGGEAMVVAGYYPKLRVKLVPASLVTIDCDVTTVLQQSSQEHALKWDPIVEQWRANYLARFGDSAED